MAYRCYCYHAKREIALLDDTEWQVIEPLLKDWMMSIKAYRAETGASIEQARTKHARAVDAEAAYFELTGDKVGHPDLLWKLRMSSYGRLCRKCQKPFRTPNAKMCAECGFSLPRGQVAGPLKSPRSYR